MNEKEAKYLLEIMEAYPTTAEMAKVVVNLENELKDMQKLADDYKNECEKLESELEVKDNLLKIKNGLCGSFDKLPSEPISVANMLINSKESRFIGLDIVAVSKYTTDDLKQIAKHLFVYCKHNREDGE